MMIWYQLVILLGLYTCSTQANIPKCSVYNIDGSIVASMFTLNCRDTVTAPAAPDAVSAPVNFTVTTLPSSKLGYRDLKYQWKFPQDGSAARVKSFMMFGGEIGQKGDKCRKYLFYPPYKATKEVLEGTVVCTKMVEVKDYRELKAWFKLFSMPRSSTPASFNHTIIYYPDINVRVDDCSGMVEVSFNDYNYKSYNMAMEFKWSTDNTTLVRPTQLLPADRTNHTFYNIPEGRYKVVVIPHKCKTCLRTVQKFEIDKSVCTTTRETTTKAKHVLVTNFTNITNTTPIVERKSTPKDIRGNSQAYLAWVLSSLGIAIGLFVAVLLLFFYCRKHSKRRYRDTTLPMYVNPLVSSNSSVWLNKISSVDVPSRMHDVPLQADSCKKVLILSTWDNDIIVRNFSKFLQQCSCQVLLSVYQQSAFISNPERWLNKYMTEADSVLVMHTQLSHDLLAGKIDKDQYQHEVTSIDLFLTAMKIIELNKEGDAKRKYVSVVWQNLDAYFDLSEVTGGVFELPDQFEDFLRHIHDIKPTDPLPDLIYKRGCYEEANWLKSLPVLAERLESGYHSDQLPVDDYDIGYSASEVGQTRNPQNMLAIEDVSDWGTVRTKFKSPAPSTRISASEVSVGAPDNTRQDFTVSNKHPCSLAIEDLSDVGTVMTELYPPSNLTNTSIAANNDRGPQQNRYDESTAECHTHPTNLHSSPSIESYTSAESIAPSQCSNDYFIPPGPEDEFKGTSRDVRNLNYQSAIQDFVNNRE